ncbi:ATP-binding protein [Streptomyces sp. NPDC088788]|uniref:ATP-binding protein n=1 Tax=Streptomyces sp. NPDC088788 TaxID=3365898 RepID=UPI003800AC29
MLIADLHNHLGGIMETGCLLDASTSRRNANIWLPADPAVVGHARTLTATILGNWGLSQFVATTQLIVSELATNAIVHAPCSGYRFRLAAGKSTLRCVVSDNDRNLPQVGDAAADDTTGRGLLLVSQLAYRWGVRVTDTGKSVWAVQRILSQ